MTIKCVFVLQSDADSVCLICHNDLNRGAGGTRELQCTHTFHKEVTHNGGRSVLCTIYFSKSQYYTVKILSYKYNTTPLWAVILVCFYSNVCKFEGSFQVFVRSKCD